MKRRYQNGTERILGNGTRRQAHAPLLPIFSGLDGVLYSMPVSDVLTFLISAVLILKT